MRVEVVVEIPDKEYEKRCSKCDKIKTDDQFSKNSNTRDGLQSWCKACKRERNREYNMTPEQIERKREYQRVENMTPEQIERKRARDRERRRVENMTPEQIERHRKRERERKRKRQRVENMTPEQIFRKRVRNMVYRAEATLARLENEGE